MSRGSTIACALLLLGPTRLVAEGRLRLGGDTRPLRQALDLTILPGEERFTGVTDIEVELRRPTRRLWLNAADLEIRTARLTFGKDSQAAQPTAEGELVGLALEREVGPGSARLRMEYGGRISSSETEGLFREREGQDWYVLSQFEATAARRAFPCFDEPAFKIPWRITLRVPRGLVAVSNSPPLSTAEGPGPLQTVSFADTPPLPSYLVALAVGPFEIVDAGRAGRKHTPIRILTPRGRASQARAAAEVTPRILERLEAYLDLPFPFEKLDQLAIPITVSFGAMENAGLVTYQEGLLLRSPAEETVGFRRGLVDVCAHELAHQWFGDLVTMAWWDDVWLNEAFASWMGSKLLAEWRPEWGERSARVASRREAMEQDNLASARRIRQPIESRHDIENAFDAITYAKGEAVLQMFEAYAGEEPFRRAVQLYLGKHAWGNATAADFLAALSARAGKNLGPAFASFLDQAGVPLVTVDLRCGEGPARVRLTQQPYRPLGSPAASNPLWQVPVCLRYQGQGREARLCTLLSGAAAEVPLGPADGCPGWVVGNDGETGYYVTGYGGDLLARLLRDPGRELSAPERTGLVGNLEALMAAGSIPAADALAALPPLVRDPDPSVVAGTIALVQRLGEELLPETPRPAYVRFVRSLYDERARGLGWSPRPGEDESARLLRRPVLAVASLDGEDPVLGAEAEDLARRWLRDPASVDPDLVGLVLRVAARRGDGRLFDQFREEALRTGDANRRRWLLAALVAFPDPERVRSALALALADGLDPRESIQVVWSAAAEPGARGLAFAFVENNLEALLSRLPRDYGAKLPRLGEGFCDPQRAEDLARFLRPQMARFAGGPRSLDNVLEKMALCSALRRAQRASAQAFLDGFRR